MRRLLRWTFHALAAASLLLCVATAGLWVRSYWVADQFHRGPRDRGSTAECSSSPLPVFAATYRGLFFGLWVWSERPEDQHAAVGIRTRRTIPPRPSGPGRSRTTPVAESYRGYGENTQTVRMPAWSLVSAFALLPAIVVLRQIRAVRRRRYRSRLGLCPACGYDLRALPDRCPECGAVPPAKGERAPARFTAAPPRPPPAQE